LILDLSSPDGWSINDGIDAELCSMAYATVDSAVSHIVNQGKGTLLAKVDIEHAYRNIPVHPDDRHLLGMRWDGSTYLDTGLPFGLRSAPKIFSSIAEALEWILLQEGVTWVLHYLDDFLIAGKEGAEECRRNLDIVCRSCQWLGIPLKLQKIEGPASVIVFLGIELDSNLLEMRLPAGKIHQLEEELEKWRRKRYCQKRELLSLIGKLSHACKVVLAGRLFLRRMIETAKSVHCLCHWVHLNCDFRSDLEWWVLFLPYWNGCSMMAVHKPDLGADTVIFTDASGVWGCGAIWKNKWLQCQWNQSWETECIATKELLPIVLAIAVWGQQWQHQRLLIRCDNMAVVKVINARNCKDPALLQLMR